MKKIFLFHPSLCKPLPPHPTPPSRKWPYSVSLELKCTHRLIAQFFIEKNYTSNLNSLGARDMVDKITKKGRKM